MINNKIEVKVKGGHVALGDNVCYKWFNVESCSRVVNFDLELDTITVVADAHLGGISGTTFHTIQASECWVSPVQHFIDLVVDNRITL